MVSAVDLEGPFNLQMIGSNDEVDVSWTMFGHLERRQYPVAEGIPTYRFRVSLLEVSERTSATATKSTVVGRRTLVFSQRPAIILALNDDRSSDQTLQNCERGLKRSAGL